MDTNPGTSYHPPLTLPLVRDRIDQLKQMIPSIEATSALSINDEASMDEWCRQMRYIVRNHNLVLNFVSTATYQWAPERSGHTQQNLDALKVAAANSSSVLNLVSTHVSKILMPRIRTDLKCTVKTTTVDNVETQTYEYESVIEDPDYILDLRQQLVEEGMEKRALMEVTMTNMSRAISDYLKVENGKSDSNLMMY